MSVRIHESGENDTAAHVQLFREAGFGQAFDFRAGAGGCNRAIAHEPGSVAHKAQVGEGASAPGTLPAKRQQLRRACDEEIVRQGEAIMPFMPCEGVACQERGYSNRLAARRLAHSAGGASLEGGREDFLGPGFDARWRCVSRGTSFERTHVAVVQRVGHFEQCPGHAGGEAERAKRLDELLFRQLHVSKRALNGRAKNPGCLFVSDVAFAEQFVRFLALEIQAHEALGGGGADIFRGDHRQRKVRSERSGHHAEVVYNLRLRQQVFHEVPGAQKEGVQPFDPGQALLEAMEAKHGPGALRFVGTNAAQHYGMRHTGVFNCASNRLDDPALILRKIFGFYIRGNKRVQGLGPIASFREGFYVQDIDASGLRAELDDGSHFVLITREDAHFLAGLEQPAGDNRTRIARSPENDVHRRPPLSPFRCRKPTLRCARGPMAKCKRATRFTAWGCARRTFWRSQWPRGSRHRHVAPRPSPGRWSARAQCVRPSPWFHPRRSPARRAANTRCRRRRRCEWKPSSRRWRY